MPHRWDQRLTIPAYAVLARDPATGDIGAAVHAAHYSYAAAVPWAHPGVGVVVSLTMAYGYADPTELDNARPGTSAQELLDLLLSRVASRAAYQVAVLDAAGNLAAYTGHGCDATAGHYSAPDVAVIGSRLEPGRAWPHEVLRAFSQARGELSMRLLTALKASHALIDRRGPSRSAALLVVSNDPQRPWPDGIVCDVRVKGQRGLLDELEQRVRHRLAIVALRQFLVDVRDSQAEAAMASLRRVLRYAPDLDEPRLLAMIAEYLHDQPGQTLDAFLTTFGDHSVPRQPPREISSRPLPILDDLVGELWHAAPSHNGHRA